MDMATETQREFIIDLINSSHTAFLITVCQQSKPHGRPMATAKAESDLNHLYFATQKSSGKVEDIQNNPNVFVGYSNATGSKWLSLTGQASISNDKALIHNLWSPIWKNWFEGPDDTNLVLIDLMPEHAEYWDSGSKLWSAVKLAYTAVTGKKTSDGENAAVKL